MSKIVLKDGCYRFSNGGKKKSCILWVKLFGKELMLSACILMGIYIQFYLYFDVAPYIGALIAQAFFLLMNVFLIFVIIDVTVQSIKEKEKAGKSLMLIYLALFLLNINFLATIVEFKDIKILLPNFSMYVFNIVFAIGLISFLGLKSLIEKVSLKLRGKQETVKRTVFIFYLSAVVTVSLYTISIVSLIFYFLELLYFFTMTASLYLIFLVLFIFFNSKISLKTEYFSEKSMKIYFYVISTLFIGALFLFITLLHYETFIQALRFWTEHSEPFISFPNVFELWNVNLFLLTMGVSLTLVPIFLFASIRSGGCFNWESKLNILVMKKK